MCFALTSSYCHGIIDAAAFTVIFFTSMTLLVRSTSHSALNAAPCPPSYPPVWLKLYAHCVTQEGETLKEAKDKVEKYTVPTLLTNYKIWPAAQVFNFYVVPLQYRVLWLNMYVRVLHVLVLAFSLVSF